MVPGQWPQAKVLFFPPLPFLPLAGTFAVLCQAILCFPHSTCFSERAQRICISPFTSSGGLERLSGVPASLYISPALGAVCSTPSAMATDTGTQQQEHGNWRGTLSASVAATSSATSSATTTTPIALPQPNRNDAPKRLTKVGIAILEGGVMRYLR